MALAVIIDGRDGGIEPTVPIAALLTVVAVDGGSNNGIFTTASHNNDHHPVSHCPCPCPPLDKDWIARWRAHRVVSHLLSPWSLFVGAIFVSTRRMAVPRTLAAETDEANVPISVAGKRWNTMTPLVWSNKKNKINYSGSNIATSALADSYARAATTAASLQAEAAGVAAQG